MVVGVKVAGRKLKMIQNKFRRIEKLLKDSFPIGNRGEGSRKKRKRYEDD